MGFGLRTWLPRLMRPARDSLSAADWQIADEALTTSAQLQNLSAVELADKSRCRTSLSSGKPRQISDSVALAAVCEAIRRVFGYLPHRTQLVAAAMLARGHLVEMATGEGKTLTAAIAGILQGLRGRTVHVMTQNSYLAERDWRTLQPLYDQFELSSSALRENDSPEQRADCYRCQIIHGSGPEFGFDYLRQQNGRRQQREKKLGTETLELLVQGSARQPLIHHDFAIVDEVDSVLIDEASLPLVLSEPTQTPSDAFAVEAACCFVGQLKQDEDFFCLIHERRVVLTARGEEKTQQYIQKVAWERLQRPWKVYVEQALLANFVFRRDVDYVVNHGKVQVVDQQTGRVFPDRTWQDGLHQAIEAKEGVALTPQNLSVARILRQQLMRVYSGMCGLTGTLAGVEREFEERLELRTIAIPLRIPSRRVELRDRFFINSSAKIRAAAEEVLRIHQQQRPILIGTRTIESSLELSKMLASRGLKHEVLNGVQDRDEAEIIAQAGQPGAITIATNLAGRGTDIRVHPSMDKLGGMHVLGLERSESRRVDLQLAGRTARQGASGSVQFLVAADDILLQRFGQALGRKMQHAPNLDGELTTDFLDELLAVQRHAEFESRKTRDRVFKAHM